MSFGAAVQAGRVYISLLCDNRPLTQSLRQSETQISGFQNRIITKTRRNSALLNSAFTGIPLTQSGLYGMMSLFTTARIIKGAGAWETKMVAIRKTTGMAAKEVRRLSKELINLVTTRGGLNLSIGEVANMAKVAGQTGMKDRTSIAGFVRTAGLLAMVTDLTAEDAASQLSFLSNTLGFSRSMPGGDKILDVNSLNKFVSVLNELENSTVATVPYLVNVTSRLAGVAKSAGYSAAEIAGLAAALREIGAKPEVGSTAMIQMMHHMRIGAGALQNKFGMKGFKKNVMTNPYQALVQFMGKYQALNKQDPAKAHDMLKVLGRRGSRLVSVVERLSQNIPLMNRAIRIAREEWEKNTSAMLEAEKIQRTFDFKLQQFINSVSALANNIGSKLLPKAKEWLDSMKGWAREMDTSTTAVNELVSTAKNLLYIWGGVKIYQVGSAIFRIAAAWKAVHYAYTAIKVKGLAHYGLSSLVGAGVGAQIGGVMGSEKFMAAAGKRTFFRTSARVATMTAAGLTGSAALSAAGVMSIPILVAAAAAVISGLGLLWVLDREKDRHYDRSKTNWGSIRLNASLAEEENIMKWRSAVSPNVLMGLKDDQFTNRAKRFIKEKLSISNRLTAGGLTGKKYDRLRKVLKEKQTLFNRMTPWFRYEMEARGKDWDDFTGKTDKYQTPHEIMQSRLDKALLANAKSKRRGPSIVVIIQHLHIHKAGHAGKVLKEIEQGILNALGRRGAVNRGM